MEKRMYAIEWLNSLGNRVIYPKRVWKRRYYAIRFATKLFCKRAIAGTIMKDIKIIELEW